MDIELTSKGDLFSIGFMAQVIQRDPRHIAAAAVRLGIKPFSINTVPHFDGDEAERIRQFLTTHAVVEDEPEATTDEGPAIMEPSAKARQYATRDPLDLLDELAVTIDKAKRLDLAIACAVSCGERSDAVSNADRSAVCDLLVKASTGDDQAIDAARQWVVDHVLTAA